jgi:hypothetical protein
MSGSMTTILAMISLILIWQTSLKNRVKRSMANLKGNHL